MNTKIGSTLSNGATVILLAKGKVMAVNEGAVQPYVIWSILADGSCHTGYYFRELSDALASWIEHDA